MGGGGGGGGASVPYCETNYATILYYHLQANVNHNYGFGETRPIKRDIRCKEYWMDEQERKWRSEFETCHSRWGLEMV